MTFKKISLLIYNNTYIFSHRQPQCERDHDQDREHIKLGTRWADDHQWRGAQERQEEQKTEAPEDALHIAAAPGTGAHLQPEQISGHVHPRGDRHVDQSYRGSRQGEYTKKTRTRSSKYISSINFDIQKALSNIPLSD